MNFFHSLLRPLFAGLHLFFTTQINCSIMAATVSYMYVNLFALYFAMEQTNLNDLCLRLKQTEISLNVWREKDVTGL